MTHHGIRFWTTVFLWIPIAVSSATLRREGDVLVITGELSVSEKGGLYERIEDPAITTIRFEDCLGGQVVVSDVLQQLIEARRLRTEAKGIVASACAVAFMAGDLRSFADNDRGDTQLIFHGVFDRDSGETNILANERVRRTLIERTHHLVDEAMAGQMITGDDRRSTFRVVHRARLIDGVPTFVFRCPLIEEAVRCEAVDGLTAESLGLVTPTRAKP